MVSTTWSLSLEGSQEAAAKGGANPAAAEGGNSVPPKPGVGISSEVAESTVETAHVSGGGGVSPQRAGERRTTSHVGDVEGVMRAPRRGALLAADCAVAMAARIDDCPADLADTAGSERSVRRTRAPTFASSTSAARGRSGVRGGTAHRDATVWMSKRCLGCSGDQPREEAEE